MSVEVIDDIPNAVKMIEKSNPPPYIFINAHYKYGGRGSRSSAQGLGVAYRILKEKPDSKIILYGVF